MALFIFFFIDIEVEKSEKKLTFTQEFGWVNKQQANKQRWLDKDFSEQQQTVEQPNKKLNNQK